MTEVIHASGCALHNMPAMPAGPCDCGAADDRRLTVEDTARICHEVNRALCIAAGDHSQVEWASAAEWQRESAIKGVRFALDNPDATPEHQHDAWSADKLAAGWVYGSVKDAEAKTHPCLVPYADLPFEQRVKDHAFRAIVATTRAMNGAEDVA